MGRRAKPKKGKTEAKRPLARKSPTADAPRIPELQARLADALKERVALSEILRVISQSPTDAQPVFEAIVRNGVQVCEANACTVFVREGEMVRLGATDIDNPVYAAQMRTLFPAPIDADLPTNLAIRERRIIHLPDTENNPEALPVTRRVNQAAGYRTVLFMPMLCDATALGAVVVARTDPAPFSERQIELLQTFADQAVIAIENVRLFKELEARNRDLTESLARQTATANILQVISQAQADVQPVFEAIADSALRLIGAWGVLVLRYEGGLLRLVVVRGGRPGSAEQLSADLREWSPDSEEVFGRAVLSRSLVLMTDSENDPVWGTTYRERGRQRGWRSTMQVPMVSGEDVFGVIGVSRVEPGGFSPAEIALLQTFADQAVIAVKNARLLNEIQARSTQLQRSVEQLTALGEVGQAVSSSLDLDTVLTTIVGRAVHLSGTDGGTIFEYDEGAEEFSPRATLNADESQSALLRATRLRRGEGAVGQLAVTRAPIQIPDIAVEGAYASRLRGALLEAGTRAVLAIPLLHEERIVGGLVVTRRTPGAFTAEVVEILKTFATQSALAIQNARLFHEIEDKSRQLEAASRHKSEFLANMSHELRTPLNAIIGYSELLEEEAGDLDGGRLVPDLQKIATAAKHQLSLINDILDLSKVEAGRMELELTEFDLPSAIENALILVRERASRRGIALGRTIDEHLGTFRGDERKVKQVLLNLLSNALKFTPEGGRIDVSARMKDGVAEIAVTDTGIGIAPEDQETVFEEFRQVGTADKKVEGTGLGLALSRKFIELHGGRIWVKSQLGAGSTFTFTLPVSR